LFPASLFHPLNTLRRAVTEELLVLRTRFGLAASFIIFMAKQRWVMETIHGNDFLSPYSDTVISDSLHATVSGKILLATMPKYERAALIGPGPYNAHTPQTIVSAEDLDEELGRLAERGYATAIDEFLLGLSAVGAPIWCAPHRPLGALILSGPTKHFSEARPPEFATAVMNTAALFSFASPHVRAVCRLLGY
jgi:DNA-binding IclR family transcriptional regulator